MSAYKVRPTDNPAGGCEILDYFGDLVITLPDPADAEVVAHHLNAPNRPTGYSIEDPIAVGSYSLLDPAGDWVVQHASRDALEGLLIHLNNFIRPA